MFLFVKGVDKFRFIVYNIDKIKEREVNKMTKVEMIKEMFEKGYKSQYSVEWFEQSFTEEQIKVFYNKFMEYLEEVR